MESISAEFIAILGVGLTLGLVMLRQGTRLDRCIERMEERTDQRFGKLEEHVTVLDADLRSQMDEVRERMAKLEGLREAITGKRAA